MTHERYTLKAWQGDSPPDRPMGVECEYTVQGPLHFNPITRREIAGLAVQAMASPALMRDHLNITTVVNGFNDRGWRVYVDIDKLFEWAGGEKRGPSRMAQEDNDMQEAAEESVQLYSERAWPLDLSDISSPRERQRTAFLHSVKHHLELHRRTSTYGQPRSVGYHINAGQHKDIYGATDNLTCQLVGSFLATSAIWAGSGMLAEPYVLHQKAHTLGEEVGTQRTDITGQKPLIMLPAHYEQGSASHPRVEIRGLDMVHSPAIRRLGATGISAVMRLAERKPALPLPLDQLLLRQPVQVVRDVSTDLTFRRTYETIGGTTITAIDHQDLFATELAKQEKTADLPPDEAAFSTELSGICAMLARYRRDASPPNLELLAGVIEWAARLQFLQNKMAALGIGRMTYNDDRLRLQDLNWDRIYPVGRAKAWWAKHPDTNALHLAPVSTRSDWRGRIIRARAPYITSASWQFLGEEGKTATHKNDYPYYDQHTPGIEP